MICECDAELPEFYRKSVRKARKEHRCDECKKPIRVGESYEHVSGKWDGRIGTYKTCPRCLTLFEFLTDKTDCHCRVHGGQFITILENMCEIEVHYPKIYPKVEQMVSTIKENRYV